MNKKDKKTWIIRYCKRNGFENILNHKYTKKEGFLKRHSSEIQAVCAIFSAFFISGASVFLAIESNIISKRQLEVNVLQNKPIITFSLVQNDDKTDTIEIYSEGISPESFSVDIANYFSFENQETSENNKPLRVFTMTDILQKRIKKDELGKIAEVYVYSRKHDSIRNYYSNIADLARDSSGEFNYWETTYNYLIRVSCEDLYHNINEYYYLYNGYNGYKVSLEFGKKIFTEREQVFKEWNAGGASTGDTNLIRFENFDSKGLFYHAVKQMRKEGIWAYNKDGKRITYGKYEPID